jgi:hypothetical protein
LLILTILFSIAIIRKTDVNYFHENIKETINLLWWHENWQNITPLRIDADSQWMNRTSKGSLRIAHALGASGTSDANTLKAAEKALNAGFSHFEVDVWLDQYAQLRCHNGPVPPALLQPSDCTIDKLSMLLNQSHQWLILDIKTNLKEIGLKIIQVPKESKSLDKLIFQLYKPDDLVYFAQWDNEFRLPAPNLPPICRIIH